MDTLIHADIFFFISTVVLVFVGILAVVALYYVIRILRDIDEVSKKAKVEASEIIDDVRLIRAKVKEQGMKAAGIVGFISKFIRKKKHKKTHE